MAPPHASALRGRLRTAQSVQAAVARERMRIARELHDEFGAAHTAMRLELVALLGQQPPCAPAVLERLRRIEALLARCARARRELIRDLWPTPDEPIDLAAELRALCRDVATTARLPVQCHVRAELPAGRLPSPLAHAMLRVVQEALTNTVAHARARRADVTLSIRGQHLVLVVRDDGRGLANGRADPHGRGLVGMRTRVTELGGQWEIESAPGQGTTVRASVPLVPADSSPVRDVA